MAYKSIFEIFIVNLKSDVVKRNHMQRLCDQYGLSPEFIEAVVGVDISDTEIDQICNQTKAYQNILRPLSKPEVGCALSHKKIYSIMQEKDIDFALILEDDIDFNDQVVDFIKLGDKLPSRFDVVLLGHHTGASRDIDTKSSVWGKHKFNENYCMHRPYEIGYGTYGYIVSKNGAKKLLSQTLCLTKPIDHYTGSDVDLNVYVVKPSIIKINDVMSDEHHSMEDRLKLDNIITSTSSLNVSWKRKVADRLKLYRMLSYIREVTKSTINKYKPLRRYH